MKRSCLPDAVAFNMVFRCDPMWSSLPPEMIEAIRFWLKEFAVPCNGCKRYFYEMGTYLIKGGYSCLECAL